MKIFFSILLLFLLTSVSVYSQEEDFPNPPPRERPNQNDDEPVYREPVKKNTEKQKKVTTNEKVKKPKTEEEIKVPTEETLQGNSIIEEVDSLNSAALPNIEKIDSNIQNEKITIEENNSVKKLRAISTLMGKSLSEAIENFTQEELKAMMEIPLEELMKIFSVSEQEAKLIQEEIKINIVKPYDKEPIIVPESMATIPGIDLVVYNANVLLTAGLDMTPKQRSRAQLVILIILICVILPEYYRNYISKK
ncbi:MAG TPA: hypothetical protein PLG90_11250 [Ignavibacteria bacterium]|nr:hypothetical protein [Ignavibacteria bacterium]